MSSRLLVAAISLAFASLSCSNDLEPTKTATRPAVATPAASANVAAPSAPGSGMSSICRVISKAHTDAKAAADAAPEDTDLRALADELKDAVDDVCG